MAEREMHDSRTSADEGRLHTVRLRVNGRTVERAVDPRRLLVDFLRHDLGLTGTHVGCEQGICGACTVHWNGEPVRSCLAFAVQADGAEITTIEVVASETGELHPVQRAFIEHHALQCGFCTPGIIMTMVHLFAHNPSPTEETIKEALGDHLCRCTGYENILRALRSVAERPSPSVTPDPTAGRGDRSALPVQHQSR